MKAIFVLTLTVLAAAVPVHAQDAVAPYKSKCAACHGPKGAGKPAMKGSNLLAPEAIKATDDQLVDAILNGGAAKKAAHAYSKKGVSADQAKALVVYLRTLQK